MKVYERYVAKEVFAATAVVTAAFLGLYGFFDLLAELRDVGRNGYQYSHALGFVALTLPGRAYEMLPIGVLIGALYGLTQLARHSEITVLRSSGLSTRQLAVSLLRVGAVFVALTLLLGELVVPPAERLAQQLKLRATGQMVAKEFRSGLWVKDGRSFVNVQNVRPDGRLVRVRIFDFDDAFRLVRLREAATGEYAGDQEWTLGAVRQTEYVGDASHVSQMPEMRWRSGLSPEVVSVLLVEPDRMPITTLVRYVSYLGENQRNAERYEIALWQKLVYPLASLVMLLLALPFAYLQDRFGAVSVKVFIGIMLGIGFHLLNWLFANLGAINGWAPQVSAATPSVIFLAAAGVLLWRVERR